MYRQHHRYKHFAVHHRDAIYRSAWLEPDALREVVDRYQIRTVVNLCCPNEFDLPKWSEERRAAKAAGVRLLELPMPASIDPAGRDIAEHVNVLRDANSYPVLVHCQHGVTRTAMLIAMYDIMIRGLSAKTSLESQPLFGREHHNPIVWAFVRNFEDRHEKLYPETASPRPAVLAE